MGTAFVDSRTKHQRRSVARRDGCSRRGVFFAIGGQGDRRSRSRSNSIVNRHCKTWQKPINKQPSSVVVETRYPKNTVTPCSTVSFFGIFFLVVRVVFSPAEKNYDKCKRDDDYCYYFFFFYVSNPLFA